MDIVLVLHSWVRWLIVLVGVIAIVKFGYSWLKKEVPAKMDRGIMSGFSGLIDVQVLLGILLILGLGLDQAYRIEHAITMIIAAAIAHVPMRWRNETSTNALRNNLFTVVAVFVVIVIGIGVLPGMRWTIRF